MFKVKIHLILILYLMSSSAFGLEILKPVKTDSPRETMRTFISSMNQYKEASEKKNESLKKRSIERAIRTLNLNQHSPLLRFEIGKNAAIYLKEVIDRVIVIDYALIPNLAENEDFNGKFWRLKNTEISIRLINDGERSGEYLFSADTVSRAKSFYEAGNIPLFERLRSGSGYRETILSSHMPEYLRGEVFGIAKWQLAGIFISNRRVYT